MQKSKREVTTSGVKATQACNFIQRRLQHSYFPVNDAKSFRTTSLKNICEGLLLQKDLSKSKYFIPCCTLHEFAKQRLLMNLFIAP